MIYICFPVFNRLALTINCINSIRNSTYKNYSIIILDDGSTDGTREYLINNFPEVILLKGNGSFYWAKGMNKCMEYVLKVSTKNDFILMLNNDVEISSTLLENLLSKSKQLDNCCIIGSLNLIIKHKDLIENSGFYLKEYLYIFKTFKAKFNHYIKIESINNELITVDTIAAKGAFTSINIIKKLGFIDDYHFRQYHGDSTFFYRASMMKIPIYIFKNATLFSHLELTGFGADNRHNTFEEILQSFFSFRSANYYKTIYFRCLLLNQSSIISFIQTIITIIYKFIYLIFKHQNA